MTLSTADPRTLSHDEKVELCIALSEMISIICNRILYPYQTKLVNKLIEAVLRAEGDEHLVLQARQSGKTEAVVNAIITLSIFYITILQQKFKAGVFAPAQSQAIQVTRARIRERIMEIQDVLDDMGIMPVMGKGRTTPLFIFKDLSTGHEATIRALSADLTANVKGEDFNLIIIEQVEDTDSSKLKSDIFPMGAAVGGVRILSGTSTLEIYNDYFYDKLAVAGPDDALIIDCNEASKYNPKYRAFIELEKERLGEDSLEFRAQYLLEWGSSIIHYIEDRTAFLLLSEATKPMKGIKKVAGWDPARMNDYSVVTVMEEQGDTSVVTDWWFSQGTNLEEQVYVVSDWLEERGVSVLAVDSIGLGVGVCDMLDNHLKSVEIIRVDMKARMQDEMFKLLDREIKTSRLRYPSENNRARALFLQQMFRVEKKFSGRSLLVEAPEGRDSHDDFCDSLGLAMWALRGDAFDAGVAVLSWSG